MMAHIFDVSLIINIQVIEFYGWLRQNYVKDTGVHNSRVQQILSHSN